MKLLKLLLYIIILAILGAFVFALMGKMQPLPLKTDQKTSINITQQKFAEPNFSGTKLVVSQDSALAKAVRDYVDKEYADFKTRADKDVPQLRKDFGSDAPPATYTIDFDGKIVASASTLSAVLSEYEYTGGANGLDLYRTFTADKNTGKLLSLADIIKPDKQDAFVNYIKTTLLGWQPAGTAAPVVFPDAVEALNFASFTNWSLDNDNLILYFSKYDIAPGAMGAIAFPIPLSKIKEFI